MLRLKCRKVCRLQLSSSLAMLPLILLLVVVLVVCALRLMEKALECQEFSLMLAGFLVASTAVAMMTVYFLMGDYFSYMTQASANPLSDTPSASTYSDVAKHSARMTGFRGTGSADSPQSVATPLLP